MNTKLAPLLLLAMSAAVIPPALAHSAGDWTVGVGVHVVDPKSRAGHLDATALGLGPLPQTRVDSDVRPTITAEYFLADNLGLEILASLPFHHTIDIDGVGRVGSTRQLPPTVSLQYHFASPSKVTPFVGLGVNYTRFFHERAQGALEGTRLDLDASWGLAVHAGVDIALTPKYALRVDARYIDISTDVHVNGNTLGKADINPMVYGAALVVKF